LNIDQNQRTFCPILLPRDFTSRGTAAVFPQQ
jgi:hypothetical protein